jgi:glycosyltransferase involved in cell wall biosynthesis
MRSAEPNDRQRVAEMNDSATSPSLYRGAHTLWRLLPVKARRRAFAITASLLCPRPTPASETELGAITVAGFLRSTTSLGEGARLCLTALSEAGYEVRFVDVGAGFGQTDYPDARFPGSPAAPGGGPLIIHANPQMLPLAYLTVGRRLLRGKYIIGYFVWELATIPRAWQKMLDLVHEIWVPSEFSKQAFTRATNKPVHVVPHPLAAGDRLKLNNRAQRFTRDQFRIPSRAFAALAMQHMGSTLSRKNMIGTIRAFKQAFGSAADRVLVLKLADMDQWPKAATRIRNEIGSATNIMLLEGKLSTEEMLGLIGCCDSILSLHRAEGFGMVLAEAMLLGKAVIATRWSGNLEFMTDENSALINYSLVPVFDEDAHLYVDKNLRWAEPDIMDAAAWLRRLASDPELRRSIGDRARRDVAGALGTNCYHIRVQKLLARNYSVDGRAREARIAAHR